MKRILSTLLLSLIGLTWSTAQFYLSTEAVGTRKMGGWGFSVSFGKELMDGDLSVGAGVGLNLNVSKARHLKGSHYLRQESERRRWNMECNDAIGYISVPLYVFTHCQPFSKSFNPCPTISVRCGAMFQDDFLSYNPEEKVFDDDRYDTPHETLSSFFCQANVGAAFRGGIATLNPHFGYIFNTNRQNTSRHSLCLGLDIIISI